jgi:DNA-binding SARP family transcriptional activator
MKTIVRAKLFGNFAIYVNDLEVKHKIWSRHDSLLLFQLLLLRRDELVTRKSIIELLWPSVDLDAGRHRLSNALSALRKDLDKCVGDDFTSALIRSTIETITIVKSKELTTDIDLFEENLDLAAMSTAAAERSDYLKLAISQYTGALLFEISTTRWVLSERELLTYRYIEALRAATLLAEESKNDSLQLAYLDKLREALPEDEDAAISLMNLHARANRASDVETVFEQLRRNMAIGSGTRPSDAAFAAYRRHAERPTSQPLQTSTAKHRPGVSIDRPKEMLVGADKVIQHTIESVVSRTSAVIAIVGPDGVGKDSIVRHVIWSLSTQHGIPVYEQAHEESAHADRQRSQKAKVRIYLNVNRQEDFDAIDSSGGFVSLVTTNLGRQYLEQRQSVEVIEVSELSQTAREELFFQRTFGLAKSDQYLCSVSPGQVEPLLTRCLRMLGGFPRLIEWIAHEYLEYGNKCFYDLGLLNDSSDWPRLDLVTRVWRDKSPVFANLDLRSKTILQLLGDTHLALTSPLLSKATGYDETDTLKALQQIWSKGLVRVINHASIENLFTATFEGRCVVHMDRLEHNIQRSTAVKEFLKVHYAIEAIFTRSLSADQRWGLVELCRFNSHILIARIKACMLSPSNDDLLWITNLRRALSALNDPERAHLHRLGYAIDAALTLASQSEELASTVNPIAPARTAKIVKLPNHKVISVLINDGTHIAPTRAAFTEQTVWSTV